MTIESRRVQTAIWKYYFNPKGQYVHAIRYITHHYRSNVLIHSSTHFMCGNFGFFNTKCHAESKIYQEAPPNIPLCRRCFPWMYVVSEERPLELPDDNVQISSDVLLFEVMK